MNAMSYFACVFRHGLYGRRPKVEIPENTESAFAKVNCCSCANIGTLETYLSAAVTRKCVVPQLLKRASQWLLVVTVVTMSSHCRREAEYS
jgi:hypothetical protein